MNNSTYTAIVKYLDGTVTTTDFKLDDLFAQETTEALEAAYEELAAALKRPSRIIRVCVLDNDLEVIHNMKYTSFGDSDLNESNNYNLRVCCAVVTKVYELQAERLEFTVSINSK
ncbi:hypothetical protein [uncultured Pontibacter sp.]|uniref:hypothetical protein n=1 Tax=uncultured Pontibacter sp. TaxID=453356 RepID=UPI00262B6E2A|nr:hypothetical protein [uncultured Pontibacter sp.]